MACDCVECPRHQGERAGLTSLLEKVVRLRALQREYFKDRERAVLIEAKQLERELDAELDAMAS